MQILPSWCFLRDKSSKLRIISVEASDIVNQLLGDKTVGDAMKPRASLPEIPAESTVAQAFRDMMTSKQNCIVVVEDPNIVIVEDPMNDRGLRSLEC